jgi:carbonic anhydrase
MSAIQKQVEKASESYSSTFTNGDLALPPAKKYLVLTCMDARIDPVQAFGIELGDAHVIRNVSAYSWCSSLEVAVVVLRRGDCFWPEWC